MEELLVGLHIHSRYSDGSGTYDQIAQSALKAGLDIIILTDHNVVIQDKETYFKSGRKTLLLLTGEEVHDSTLLTGKNHLLIFGHNREMAAFSKEPQNLIDQSTKAGGITFLAHPIEDALEKFGESSFCWEDWSIHNFTGIELWNHMSEFKSRSTTIPKVILHALIPRFMAKGPLEETLELWDKLIQEVGGPIVAIGGVDAHALKKSVGPIVITLYPYNFHFMSITTHIFVDQRLSGVLSNDKKMVIDALRTGHAFVAYDLPHSTKGFRFTVNNKDGLFIMGDTVSASGGLTFQVRLPIRTYCKLIKDGKVVKETRDREVITYLTSEPGVYRVEAYIDYLGQERGWIFSNPIYAKD